MAVFSAVLCGLETNFRAKSHHIGQSDTPPPPCHEALRSRFLVGGVRGGICSSVTASSR